MGLPAVWKVNLSASGMRRELEYTEFTYFDFNLKMEKQFISTETTTKTVNSNWFRSSGLQQLEPS